MTGIGDAEFICEELQKNFWQIWNMSFGFFGIQAGRVMGMANMSAI